MTSTNHELLVIEIPEDAYKQNAVYRPWEEMIPIGVSANAGRTATQQHALKVLTGINKGQAATGVPILRTAS